MFDKDIVMLQVKRIKFKGCGEFFFLLFPQDPIIYDHSQIYNCSLALIY